MKTGTKKPALIERRRSITVRLSDTPWQKLEDIRHWLSRDEGKVWSSNAVVINLIEEAHKRLTPQKRPKRAANG